MNIIGGELAYLDGMTGFLSIATRLGGELGGVGAGDGLGQELVHGVKAFQGGLQGKHLGVECLELGVFGFPGRFPCFKTANTVHFDIDQTIDELIEVSPVSETCKID